MTVEELRARRRELLAWKAEELHLQEIGQGEQFNLFMVEEELLEVNAQLRSLTNGRRIGTRTISADRFNGHGGQIDQHLYKEWAEHQSAGQERCSRRDELMQLLQSMEEVLTDKQLEYLRLWGSGLTMKEIAERQGVNISTVSRLISRAKQRMQEAAQAQDARRRAGGRDIDLAAPGNAQLILSALTAKQAMYLYLYYAEWLSLREIAELLGLNSHQSVMVSIHTGLRNIGRVLGYDVMTLSNLGALDDMTLEIYQNMNPEDLLPAAERERVKRLPLKSKYRYIRQEKLPHVRVEPPHGGAAEPVWLPLRRWHQSPRCGRLLEALLERQRAVGGDGASLRIWLSRIFSKITKNLGGMLCRRNKTEGYK